MFLPRSQAANKTIRDCHEGMGLLDCCELLADYRRSAVGIRYVHDNLLEPGCSIGLHAHDGDEELYLIISGTGELDDDGEVRSVGPGDACLTRSGQRHALVNTGDEVLRLVVVNCRVVAEGDERG